MPPTTILILAENFGAELDAAKVARAIARGLHAADPEREVLTASIGDLAAASPAQIDARLHAAHALILAPARLDRETLLRRDGVFELATRARQRGVPCYAVAGAAQLDAFEARMLDLQVVLGADDARALARAGRRLAGLL